jgi:two-component system response regulator AtoC
MPLSARILAVCEDFSLRRLIETFLEAEGHLALCVSSPAEALEVLRNQQAWDFLIVDAARNKCMETLFNSELLRRFGTEKLCILAEMGDVSWKSHAQKWQISKVLVKPLVRGDMERLIADSMALKDVPAKLSSVPMRGTPPYVLEELGNDAFFMAASPAMLELHRNIRILASVDHPVLILGESGVGKEVVARLLHKYHARADKQFLNVNTAALPSDLLESELFGYEVGAFTGALKAKPGKFELAEKGTLLLDEIGEMSPHMQAKLLHVLQDGSFSRLGARSTTFVDVRILAATNVNLEVAIAEKRFREDLYYRLNAFTINVPPLRERRYEIPWLVEQMMKRASTKAGQQPLQLSNRLMEAAQEYHWPGNLRELRNFVTRLLVLQDQESSCEDLRAKTRARSGYSLQATVGRQEVDFASSGQTGMKGVVSGVKYETEGRMIREALTASGWNRRRAATNLNISYRALLYKIQQHGLTS